MKKLIIQLFVFFFSFHFCSSLLAEHCEIIRCKNENNFLIVPIEIENRLYYFLLDTTATFDLSIKKDLLTQINIQPTGRTLDISDQLGYRIDKIEYELSGLKIGNTSFDHIYVIENTEVPFSPFVTVDNGEEPSLIELDGIIGIGLLQNKNYTLDFQGNNIFLGDFEECIKQDELLDLSWTAPLEPITKENTLKLGNHRNFYSIKREPSMG